MRSLISSAALAAVALSVSVESLSHSKFHNIEFNLDKRSTPDTWRQVTSIYQVMTDRFARTDGSTTASCDVTKNDYCGGTWQGIIKQLPYIQGMGHDAVGLLVPRYPYTRSLS